MYVCTHTHKPACVTSGHFLTVHKAFYFLYDLRFGWRAEAELWREAAADAEDVEQGTGPCL